MSAGKGDAPRPLSVPPATFADRWAQTFGVVDDGIVYERKEITQMLRDAAQQASIFKADPPPA